MSAFGNALGERRSRRLVGLAIIGVLIALGLPELGLPRLLFGDTPIGVRIGREIVWLALGGFMLAWVVAVERLPLSSIGLVRPTWRTLAWGLAGAVLLLATVMLSFAVIVPALGWSQNMAATRAVVDVPLWLLLTTPLVAGVTEEIVYRGYAIERLYFLTGRRWLGAIVAGAAFLLTHASWGDAQMIVVMFGTVILTSLYLWRRDLVCVMIAHSCADLAGFLLARMQS